MDNNVQTGEQKSKLVAGLLAFFAGTMGIHNFYLGYTTKGILQLAGGLGGWFLFGLLAWTIIGLGLCVIPLGIWVWAVIEGIMIFTGKINRDANGVPLKD